MISRISIPPFTASALRILRKKLITPDTLPKLPPHTVTSSKPPVEAAVLIPLMNVNGEPCVLMEVRNKNLRVHAGEASFPGGKADDTDTDLVHTALREAHEELFLPSEHVEILGRLPPEYSLGNRSRVWPFVGFVHSTARRSTNDSPLASLPLSTLDLSPAEVAAVLPLPLSTLQDATRRSTHYFRLDTSKPYHKVRCEDLVLPNERLDRKDVEGLEVWGLSGWFLNKLAERAGWVAMPPKGEAPEG
ncbi:hypothetical protein IAU60_001695 [Kwoniella sp. DSM 27419]